MRLRGRGRTICEWIDGMASLVGGVSSGARSVPDINNEIFQVARSNGPYVWDTQGRRYIDTALGFGATVLGHANPDVVSAVKAAIDRGPMPAFAHALEEEAAQALASQTGELSKVIFVNTGSEAIELACRAARAITGKATVAKFAAGYNGWFDGMAFGNAQSGEASMSANQRPVRKGTALLRFNDLADFDQLLAESDDIAAIIVEPVLANAGCIVPDRSYLAQLAASARARGILIIADEVLMGFRLHAGLSSDRFGLKPDLAAVGKAIGSGFVVAAVVGKPEVMGVFESNKANRQGTYNGNPVACAAVIATLAQLRSLDYASMEERGDLLRQAIISSFGRRGVAVSTSGFGQVFTVWPTEAAPRSYAQAQACFDQGFIMAMHRHLRDAGLLSMAPPFGRHYLSAAHDREILGAMELAFDVCAGTMFGSD